MERIVDIVFVLACCVLSLPACGGFTAGGGSAAAVASGAAGTGASAGTASGAAAFSGLAMGDGASVAISVACFLVAVIVAFACEWSASRVRALGPIACCVVAAIAPEGLYVIPAAAYELARVVREPWPWRAMPVAIAVPFVAAVLREGVTPALLLAAMLSAFAVLLSLRTSSLLSQRDLRHRTRDDLRRRELGQEGGSSRGDMEMGGEGAAGPAAMPHPSADDRCRAAFGQLTDREYEVVRLIAEGLDNHEIAAAAFISEGTVRNRISSVLQKTGCKNRTQLAVAWWQART